MLLYKCEAFKIVISLILRGSKGFDGECEGGEAIRRRALYVFLNINAEDDYDLALAA